MSNKKLNIIFFEANSNDFSNLSSIDLDSAPIVEFRGLNGEVSGRVGLYKMIYPDFCQGRKDYSKKDLDIIVDDRTCFKERITVQIKLLKSVIDGFINFDNLYKIFKILKDESRDKSIDFESVESCKEFYKFYTDYLFSRMRLSKIKGNAIKRGTASAYQSSMVSLFSCVLGLSREEVCQWYYNISNNRRYKKLSSVEFSNEEFKISYALNRRVFEGIFDFIFEGEVRPLFIKCDDIVEKDLLYISSSYHSWRNGVKDLSGVRSLSYDNERFFNFEEALKYAEDNGRALSSYEKSQLHRWCNKNLVSDYDYRIKKLANFAVFSFISVLVSETGANANSILNIDIESGKLEKEIGQYRVISVKGRSNYQKQQIRVPVSFLPTWRKYLKLREWMIERSTNGGDVTSFSVYYPLGNSNDNNTRPVRPEHLSNRASYLIPFDSRFIPLSQWRKRKSQSLTNNSDGDLSISSAVLNQSISTARKHYSSAGFSTSAVEFHLFFEELNKYSKLIVRDEMNVPPVIEDGLLIKSGRCKGTTPEDAKKIEYIDYRVPEPNCKTSLHCVFCTSFGIHKDINDIKKILSMKVWATYQSRSSLEGIEDSLEKYSGIIQRIDAIIQGFLEHYPESKSLYDAALFEISNGKFDGFWGAKIRSYIESGDF